MKLKTNMRIFTHLVAPSTAIALSLWKDQMQIIYINFIPPWGERVMIIIIIIASSYAETTDAV